MTTQFLDRGEGQIAYDDTGGTGPLVLLAPGMGDVRALYRFLAPRLVAGGYRVVTMDVRGHGESTARWRDYSPEAVGDDMVALLRAVNGGPAVVVGESFTPSSAIWAAAEAPDLVTGIVLCAPFISEVKLNPFLRVLSGLIVRSPMLWTRFFYPSLYPTNRPSDFAGYTKALRANLREPGRMAAVRAMVNAPKARANARLTEVRCPVLVIMGTKDPDFPDPAAEAQLAADTAADGTVAMIDGAGHYPPAELPDETAAALLTFLARVRERQA